MSSDRQAIERRDFPIARRGYDPAAVDAHLRALADEIERLSRAGVEGAQASSLAAAGGTQVQSILQAAETAAADIERQALESAETARAEADRDARSTRDQAIEQARAHVGAVAAATAVLLERVGSMDGELQAVVKSLRAGASRLADDLTALDRNMGTLYDAAAGGASTTAGAEPARPAPAPSRQASPRQTSPGDARTAPQQAQQGDAPSAPGRAPSPPDPGLESAPASPPAVANGDLDGARLTALNMALNGESRADTDRYLAEHFQLADRQALIDEVYAAIEA